MLVFLIISHVAKAQADVWDGLTATEPAGWTAGDAAVNISSAAELAWVAQMVNEDRQTGNTASDKMFISCTLTLTTDIELAGHEWTPIGIGLSNTDLYSIKKNCFRGTFEWTKPYYIQFENKGYTYFCRFVWYNRGCKLSYSR